MYVPYKYIHVSAEANQLSRVVAFKSHFLCATSSSQCCILTAKVHGFREVSRPGSYLHHCSWMAHWQVFSSFKISDTYRNNIPGSHYSWLRLILHPFSEDAAVEFHSNRNFPNWKAFGDQLSLTCKGSSRKCNASCFCERSRGRENYPKRFNKSKIVPSQCDIMRSVRASIRGNRRNCLM